MTCGEEMSLSIQLKIIFVMKKIDEIVIVFILTSNTVSKMNDFFQIRMHVLEIINHNFQKGMDSYSVVSITVRKNTNWVINCFPINSNIRDESM